MMEMRATSPNAIPIQSAASRADGREEEGSSASGKANGSYHKWFVTEVVVSSNTSC